MEKKTSTSWQNVSHWYNSKVGEEGHYYHQKVILPNLARILKSANSVLDFACGQGVLSRQLGKGVEYLGVDAAPSLIKEAKRMVTSPKHSFEVADVTKNLNFSKKDFESCTVILALQNIEDGEKVILNAANHLKKEGLLVLVLNHPCFRIPRQSSWQVDESKKLQYRRLDRYMSPLQIPIHMHPGAGAASAQTISFHVPLSTYTQWLANAGFAITNIEEWCSDKVSEGKMAKMENRAREEFPLFLTIVAQKYR